MPRPGKASKETRFTIQSPVGSEESEETKKERLKTEYKQASKERKEREIKDAPGGGRLVVFGGDVEETRGRSGGGEGLKKPGVPIVKGGEKVGRVKVPKEVEAHFEAKKVKARFETKEVNRLFGTEVLDPAKLSRGDMVPVIQHRLDALIQRVLDGKDFIDVGRLDWKFSVHERELKMLLDSKFSAEMSDDVIRSRVQNGITLIEQGYKNTIERAPIEVRQEIKDLKACVEYLEKIEERIKAAPGGQIVAYKEEGVPSSKVAKPEETVSKKLKSGSKTTDDIEKPRKFKGLETVDDSVLTVPKWRSRHEHARITERHGEALEREQTERREKVGRVEVPEKVKAHFEAKEVNRLFGSHTEVQDPAKLSRESVVPVIKHRLDALIEDAQRNEDFVHALGYWKGKNSAENQELKQLLRDKFSTGMSDREIHDKALRGVTLIVKGYKQTHEGVPSEVRQDIKDLKACVDYLKKIEERKMANLARFEKDFGEAKKPARRHEVDEPVKKTPTVVLDKEKADRVTFNRGQELLAQHRETKEGVHQALRDFVEEIHRQPKIMEKVQGYQKGILHEMSHKDFREMSYEELKRVAKQIVGILEEKFADYGNLSDEFLLTQMRLKVDSLLKRLKRLDALIK